jgi:hypothetical protein
MSRIDNSYIEQMLNNIINLDREVFAKLNAPPTKQTELYKLDRMYAKQSKLLNTIRNNLVELKNVMKKIEDAEKQK